MDFLGGAIAGPSMLPEELKNIQPAGECRREAEPLSKAAVPARVEEPKPDLSCAIAPSELLQLLKARTTVVADVRTATEFSAFHMDGALNTTASALRTMDFLRGKTIVLVGNGKAEREQYAACARLKANGFKQVKVLRGGILAWLFSGQPLLGRAPDAIQSAQLSPGELWVEGRFASNLILVPPGRQEIKPLLPSAIPIPDEKPSTIQAAIGKRRHNQPASVILISEKATDGATVSALRQAISPLPLLTYAGTAEALSRQITQQQAVWAAQSRGPKQRRCGG